MANLLILADITIVFVILIGIVAVMGNGLVLYAAYRKNNSMKLSVLRDLDIVIKSLAINDLLIGLVGIPTRPLANWNGGNYIWADEYDKGINFNII